MRVWNGFFPDQLTDVPVAPAPLDGTTLQIGGSTATVVPHGTTDTGHSTVLSVPGLSLVVSGDVVYNQTHTWLARSSPETRANWAKALDAVGALGPTSSSPATATRRRPTTTRAARSTKASRYLADFEAALERGSSPAELVDRMTAAYPGWANPYSLWVAAYDLLGTTS